MKKYRKITSGLAWRRCNIFDEVVFNVANAVAYFDRILGRFFLGSVVVRWAIGCLETIRFGFINV